MVKKGNPSKTPKIFRGFGGGEKKNPEANFLRKIGAKGSPFLALFPF